MRGTFNMSIEDIFFLRDGRTVFAGRVDEGEIATIEPGPATVFMNGNKIATVKIEREVIASRAQPLEPLAIRAISTRDATGLTKEMVKTNECKLEGMMTYPGHRHLLGIDSPPKDYVPDNMTLGPRLPEGWDGDAWMDPANGGFFLRAWNKIQARCAIAQSSKYEEARKTLLDEIAQGGRRVEIRVTETKENVPS
jgi:hypothetical protein